MTVRHDRATESVTAVRSQMNSQRRRRPRHLVIRRMTVRPRRIPNETAEVTSESS
jgi:hypothetical protein